MLADIAGLVLLVAYVGAWIASVRAVRNGKRGAGLLFAGTSVLLFNHVFGWIPTIFVEPEMLPWLFLAFFLYPGGFVLLTVGLWKVAGREAQSTPSPSRGSGDVSREGEA